MTASENPIQPTVHHFIGFCTAETDTAIPIKVMMQIAIPVNVEIICKANPPDPTGSIAGKTMGTQAIA